MSITTKTKRFPHDMVYNLDAANPKSYPGTGTTWHSVGTPGTASGTVLGTVPPLVIDRTKCFDFQANLGLTHATAVSGFSFPSMRISRDSGFTIECWVKNIPSVVNQQGLFSNTADGNGFRFGVGLNGVYFLVGPPHVETAISFTSPFINTEWNHIGLVYDRRGYITGSKRAAMYLNGVFQGQAATNTTINSYTGWDTIYISRGLGSFPSYSGKLASIRAYNRPFSDADMLACYQSTSSRFR